MSQSPVVANAAVGSADVSLKRYQDGWGTLNTLLRKGGSLSGREQNCCYLNLGSAARPRFADISHVSGLDGDGDGRGLALADWDGDGDLDIWMSNRTGPRVQYLQNDTEPKPHFVAFRLQGTRVNRDAIGARIEVKVAPSLGTLSRTVTAGDGYLSQSSKEIHIGLGNSERITRVGVRWPGSREFEQFQGVQLDRVHVLVEGTGSAAAWRSTALGDEQPMATQPGPTAPYADKAVIVGRLPMPRISVQLQGRDPYTLSARQPTLLLLWAPDCPHCLAELTEWADHSKELQDAHLDVVALTLAGDPETLESTERIIAQTEFPFPWATVDPNTLATIETYLAFFQQDYQRPLTVPMSLLLDQSDQLAIVYRSAVAVDEVMCDLPILDESPEVICQTRIPFRGKWLRLPRAPDPLRFATQLNEQWGTSAATDYFQHLIELADGQAIPMRWKGEAAIALGTILLSEGRFADALRFSELARSLLPNDPRPWGNQGAALWKLARLSDALTALDQGLAIQPDRASILVNRALIYQEIGRPVEAIRDWEALLQVNPDDDQARLTVATLHYALGDDRQAAEHYRAYLTRNPRSSDAMGALAWILATSPDSNVQNGPRAVELARRWSEHDRADYKALNTLAAALAATHDFAAAVSTIDQAIALARKQGDTRSATAYQGRRRLYVVGSPYRRPQPKRTASPPN